MTDPAIESILRLSLVSGVGPRLRQALLARFGTPAAILAATPSQLCEVPGIGRKLSLRIAAAQEEIDVDQELTVCQRHDISLVPLESPDYPRSLREIPDPPGLLFVRGSLQPQDALGVAIVGSRHATHYGLAQAERLAASLVRAGLTVISGLARGIDGAAHRGALNAGGRTIAVLGGGLVDIYPPEHAELARDVAAQGAVLTETPVRAAPVAGSFPQRNRIISGMSLGVIVVEAAVHSGALITARHAMEQGREVFAVPGRVDNRMSHGCHRLIRDGAKLVETADDVLEELGPLVEAAPRASEGPPIHHPAELLLNEVEQQVLGTISLDPLTVDQVIAKSGLTTPQVLSTLSILEMRRLVKRLGGNLVARP
jgi:DNA processing protein